MLGVLFTQAKIISRTVKSEHEGRSIFYGMMCLESLIAMIWYANWAIWTKGVKRKLIMSLVMIFLWGFIMLISMGPN